MRQGMKRLVPVLAFALACGPQFPNEPCKAPDEVIVAVSAVTLGDEGCSTSSGVAAFAAPPQGDCAGDCSFTCRGSSVQLSIVTGQQPANVVVTAVRLKNAQGATVATLTPSNPRAWNAANGKYVSWNQLVFPATSLQVQYDLTSPTWSTISGARVGYGYSETYKTEVDVTVNGVPRTLQGPDAQREPPVVT